MAATSGKVLAEQNNLRQVASGKTVSHSVALVPVSLPAAAASVCSAASRSRLRPSPRRTSVLSRSPWRTEAGG